VQRKVPDTNRPPQSNKTIGTLALAVAFGTVRTEWARGQPARDPLMGGLCKATRRRGGAPRPALMEWRGLGPARGGGTPPPDTSI